MLVPHPSPASSRPSSPIEPVKEDLPFWSKNRKHARKMDRMALNSIRKSVEEKHKNARKEERRENLADYLLHEYDLNSDYDSIKKKEEACIKAHQELVARAATKEGVRDFEELMFRDLFSRQSCKAYEVLRSEEQPKKRNNTPDYDELVISVEQRLQKELLKKDAPLPKVEPQDQAGTICVLFQNVNKFFRYQRANSTGLRRLQAHCKVQRPPLISELAAIDSPVVDQEPEELLQLHEQVDQNLEVFQGTLRLKTIKLFDRSEEVQENVQPPQEDQESQRDPSLQKPQEHKEVVLSKKDKEKLNKSEETLLSYGMHHARDLLQEPPRKLQKIEEPQRRNQSAPSSPNLVVANGPDGNDAPDEDKDDDAVDIVDVWSQLVNVLEKYETKYNIEMTRLFAEYLGRDTKSLNKIMKYGTTDWKKIREPRKTECRKMAAWLEMSTDEQMKCIFYKKVGNSYVPNPEAAKRTARIGRKSNKIVSYHACL